MSNKFLDTDGCIKVTMFNNHASKGTESENEKKKQHIIRTLLLFHTEKEVKLSHCPHTSLPSLSDGSSIPV